MRMVATHTVSKVSAGRFACSFRMPSFGHGKRSRPRFNPFRQRSLLVIVAARSAITGDDRSHSALILGMAGKFGWTWPVRIPRFPRSEGEIMPIVTVQQGPRNVELKRDLVRRITDAFVDAYQIPAETVQ